MKKYPHRVEKFLQDHIELIDNFKFDELFNLEDAVMLYPIVVQPFYDIDLDPLKYMTIIPDGLFEHCNWMSSITIPTNITRIKSTAFNESSFETITIEEGVKRIDYLAFANSALKQIHFPKSVTELGQYVCCYCRELTEVTLPPVEVIPHQAFYNCNIQKLRITSGVKWSHAKAFGANISLQKLVLPDTIEALNDECFSGCCDLTEICYQGTIKQWNYVYKGDLVFKHVPAKVVHCLDGDTEL